MPEGHVVHAQARRLRRMFAGRTVRVDSPQGRFDDGAALVDGQAVRKVEAHGKHLFIGFANGRWVHVHLGLYGKWQFGVGASPAPVGQVRARIVADGAWAELRGPTVCEVLDDTGRREAIGRIGPDPIRRDADPAMAWAKASRSAAPIGILLMDQRVFAGVGNIYRAEVLYRHGISPYRESRALSRDEFDAIWADLVGLMREGARRGRIDTVRREHTPRAMGRPRRQDRHGGEVYVYRRAGQSCLACGTPVASAELNGRSLYWCPRCQPD